MQKESKVVSIIRYLIYTFVFIPLVTFQQFLLSSHFGKVVVPRPLVEIMAYSILILEDRNCLPPQHIFLYLFAGRTFLFGIRPLSGASRFLPH
jgi:hypothetical protein